MQSTLLCLLASDNLMFGYESVCMIVSDLNPQFKSYEQMMNCVLLPGFLGV